ncbi:MAG TPA: hypothetical protein VFN48_11685 [Solirubrobacteraceae bacterium]|nr:hypothetical protein [Solirubrobacteraceae bacterium]
MKNATLQAQLEAFTTESALRLSLALSEGAEVPFDVVESTERGVALYCYRPRTAEFIRARLGLLAGLPTYAAAARGLEYAPGLTAYLRARGEARIPERERDRADAALRCFLSRVFAERTEFAFDTARFAAAYAELERCLYDGQWVLEVVTPILGLALDPDTPELALGGGLSLIRQTLLGDAPAGLLDGLGPAGVLAVLRLPQTQPGPTQPAIAEARQRFRTLLTALRLYEPGAFGAGPLGFWRIDGGAWTATAIGPVGRLGSLTEIPAAQEDELRGFVNLIARRVGAASGEVRWALARFEFGADRRDPYETLTDHLLALRALLEPEGTASGRLAQRLSVICAPPDERVALAERTARAIALESAVILGEAAGGWRGGMSPEDLIAEIGGHLRAILRDVLCGHLDPDVRALADELLAEAAEV